MSELIDHAIYYLRDVVGLHVDADAVEQQRRDLIALRAQVATLTAMAEKVNAIRNSIIGAQTVNWSEHVYPLVAALNEAGFKGLDYAEARENVGSLIEQVATLTAENGRLNAFVSSRGKPLDELESMNDDLCAEVEMLTAELANKSRLFAACDAAHTELTEQYLVATRELARVKALVEGAPVEWRRYKECRTGLIYNDRHSISGEYELIELIARPNLNLEQNP